MRPLPRDKLTKLPEVQREVIVPEKRFPVLNTKRPGSTYRALRRHRDPMRSAFHAPAHS